MAGNKGPNYSFQAKGLKDGEALVPLSQVSRIAQLLDELPIALKNATTCHIEISGTQMDISGVGAGLNEFTLVEPNRVKRVSWQGDSVVFEVDCDGLTRIVLHTRARSAGASTTSDASLASASGESRGGYSSRSTG